MKRKIMFLLITIVFSFSFLSFLPYNDNKSYKNEQQDNSIDASMEEIYKEFIGILPGNIVEEIDAFSGASGFQEVFLFLKNALLGENNKLLKAFLRFLGISLIFIFAEIFTCDIGELSSNVKSTVTVCLCVPVLLFAKDVIMDVRSGIEAGSEFFSGLIPIMSSVLAIGTGTSTSAVSATGMSISLSFISGFLTSNLLPVATLIFSLSLISGFDTGQGMASVTRGLRNWFNFGIGLVSLLLVGILSFQCAITVSADTMALRGVRYAASNMIPVVGSVISGAVSTLASGIKMLSSAIGAVSCIVLLVFMGAPLLSLLFYRFALGSAATICALSGVPYGQRFFEAVRGALDCVIGILASSLLIYMIEIILFAGLAGKIL